MSRNVSNRVFLSEKEARDHQEGIKTWSSPYSESYGRGVKQCMIKLEDGSLVSGWKSEYETYSG